MRELVVGTRGSALATSQTRWVVERLLALHPGLRVRTEIIKTEGDVSTKAPLWQIGGQGLFVKEIERALGDGQIDFAVHSMKDLPSTMMAGLALAAVPEREDPRDVCISRHGLPLAKLPRAARVGTSSSRRRAQLLAFRPDLEIVPLRGNVDTRLRKSEGEDLDAVVLAAAGLARLGYLDRVTEFLSTEVCLPAVGQGFLAIQARADDAEVLGLLSLLDHAQSHVAADAERALLQEMGGGCQLPLAAMCRMEGEALSMDAMAASLDGARVIRQRQTGDAASPVELGRRVANALKAMGAEELLANASGSQP